ncbi:hypothetical protein [Ectothiorhodospira sp. BSL-9]|uniref:hypothetical protein n=1 Tax=Ectothiorhodospira sp. BSL-9 TaxID=1442136 RepID=UPI0007B4534D|nr:hypothetical protein [Ectothiorhodospira sp. BSL-9]ANB01208.1 hypothetical protein ECTOBSL9_0265 [Ectothiorhodospira sp. BSL-9]
MRRGYGKIAIFAEKDLRDYMKERKSSVIHSIENEQDDYLLNVNESDYVRYKVDEAFVDPLEIHVDQIYASSSEQMIPAEYFPQSFHVYSGKSYKKDVIKFHIPFSGNLDLLRCAPSTRVLWSMDVEIAGNEFSFEIINFSDNAESIGRDRDSNIRSIMQQLGNVSSEVERYNSVLHSQIKQAFEARKQRILAKSNVLASLGVPIKKAGNVSSTFSVPTPQKRKKVTFSRPAVAETGYKPEPSLDQSAYTDILRLIHDVGKEFERLPSLYAGKEEEHLRDHFLMMLEPNFEGSATGETFNKTGKTDILLRYEGKNVFIAECKFWRGQKNFLDTITQLLGYLTWRDSKAAVIMFVPNKDFTSALETAKQAISEHQNFIEYKDQIDETWLNYSFHLNGDRNRAVRIAVMLYHTPR